MFFRTQRPAQACLSRRRPWRRRPGAIHAVEILLLAPIMLILILGMVEYSLLLAVEQQLTLSSREGARVAAQGGSASEVEAAARLILGAGKVGQTSVVTSQLTAVSGDPVWVQVVVADASTVVPDLLRFVGFGMQGKPLTGLTTMRRE